MSAPSPVPGPSDASARASATASSPTPAGAAAEGPGRAGLARRLRAFIRRRPAVEGAYRLLVAVVGGAVVLAGLVMLVLPGPGIAALLVGLTILASEFHWARRLAARTRQLYERARRHATDPGVRRRNQALALLVLALVLAGGVLYLWRYGLALPL